MPLFCVGPRSVATPPRRFGRYRVNGFLRGFVDQPSQKRVNIAPLGGVRRNQREITARGIVALTTDPKVRADFVELGKKRALDFSWDKAAERTLEVYGEALARGGR